MTPNEWLLDETRGWVKRAEKDLRAAEICAAELPAKALYHCQQAAEKYLKAANRGAGRAGHTNEEPAFRHAGEDSAEASSLKAYLTWNQKAFRKTHELRELTAACSLIDPALGPALDSAGALSKYAWRFRYPGAPCEPDAGEAAEGRSLAELVRAEISRRLPEEVLS